MFIYEKVSEQDSKFYEEIFHRTWFENLSQWCHDKEQEIYIYCIGKRGPETPVFHKLYYKKQLIEFCIYERYEASRYDWAHNVYIDIPFDLGGDRLIIEQIIREAFDGINWLNHGMLPDITNYPFIFKVICH